MVGVAVIFIWTLDVWGWSRLSRGDIVAVTRLTQIRELADIVQSLLYLEYIHVWDNSIRLKYTRHTTDHIADHVE